MFLRWWLVKSLALLSALLAVLPLFAADQPEAHAPSSGRPTLRGCALYS